MKRDLGFPPFVYWALHLLASCGEKIDDRMAVIKSPKIE
jgi:hypothetical protein